VSDRAASDVDTGLRRVLVHPRPLLNREFSSVTNVKSNKKKAISKRFIGLENK
jgi:hypothetical protein